MPLLLWSCSPDTKSKIRLESFCQNFDFVLGEHNEWRDNFFQEFRQFLEMTSNSWNFRNFRMKKIFGQFCNFVSGEHKLTGGRSRNFSWKWRRILGIFKILGNDVEFLEFSKFSNEKNFWPILRFCIRRT